MPPLRDQGWWLETWRQLDGDPHRARAIRAAGESLCDGPFWKLIHSELVALGANRAERSALHGRLGLAALLQVVLHVAPSELGALVRALCQRERAGDFIVAALATPIFKVFEVFSEVLAAGASEGLATLAQHGEIVAWDAGVEGSDAGARRQQARYILAYRDAVPSLREQRIGVMAAARWSTDEVMRARLVRVGGRLEPRMLFTDMISVAVLAALRLRIQLARLGRPLPVPDTRVFDVSPTRLALAAYDSSAAPAKPKPAAAARSVPRSDASTAGLSTPPRAEPAPDERSAITREPPPKPVGKDTEWLAAAKFWAKDRPRALDNLFEVALRLKECRLWSQLASEVARLPDQGRLREQEVGRLALATLLDEFVRGFPGDYRDLLDLLAVEPSPDMRAGAVGELWAMLEPLFCSWARQLDPSLDTQDKGKVIRTLSRFGDILPWDDDTRGSPEKRRRAQDSAIDSVYTRGITEPGAVSKAVFWAATRARNDSVHRKLDSLGGRVRPMDLLIDVTALAALATIRFRLRIADDTKSDASVPSLSGISAALMALVRGKAR